jgi:hypothetical protein
MGDFDLSKLTKQISPYGALLGGGLGLLGLIGQGIKQGNVNRKIRGYMNQIQAPTNEGVDLAKQQLNETQLQQVMPGMREAEAALQQQQATAQSNINRAATDPNAVIAGAGALLAQTNKAQEGLAAQQAQYGINNLAAKGQARQTVAQALAQKQAAYNDYLQSLISGQATIAQNNPWSGVSQFGGGLLNLASYGLGRSSGYAGAGSEDDAAATEKKV